MTKEIPIRCQGTNYLDIHEFQNFQGNLKELKESEFKKLKKSIDKYGFRFPVFVWNKFILDGHQRIFTVNKMCQDGYSIGKIPIVEIEADSEKEAKQLVLLVSSRYGHVTDEGLYEFISMNELDWEELKTEIDLPEIKPEEFERNFFKEETEGDDDIPEDVEPITKTGDLYELGNHRLLCGDSTKREDVERLMDGKKADIVVTDPPYGMNLNTDWSGIRRTGKSWGVAKQIAGKAYPAVIGDDKPFNAKLLFEYWSAEDMFLFGADYYSNTLIDREKGSWMVWDKRKESQADGFGSEFELIWCKQKHKRRILRHEWFGFLREGEHRESRTHPTQKSISLIIDILKQWAIENCMVTDPFLGSGSTLIACEKTNRICYGMEIDPFYCDVIVERYKQFCIKNEIEAEIKRNSEVIWP